MARQLLNRVLSPLGSDGVGNNQSNNSNNSEYVSTVSTSNNSTTTIATEITTQLLTTNEIAGIVTASVIVVLAALLSVTTWFYCKKSRSEPLLKDGQGSKEDNEESKLKNGKQPLDGAKAGLQSVADGVQKIAAIFSNYEILEGNRRPVDKELRDADQDNNAAAEAGMVTGMKEVYSGATHPTASAANFEILEGNRYPDLVHHESTRQYDNSTDDEADPLGTIERQQQGPDTFGNYEILEGNRPYHLQASDIVKEGQENEPVVKQFHDSISQPVGTTRISVDDTAREMPEQTTISIGLQYKNQSSELVILIGNADGMDRLTTAPLGQPLETYTKLLVMAGNKAETQLFKDRTNICQGASPNYDTAFSFGVQRANLKQISIGVMLYTRYRQNIGWLSIGLVAPANSTGAVNWSEFMDVVNRGLENVITRTYVVNRVNASKQPSVLEAADLKYSND